MRPSGGRVVYVGNLPGDVTERDLEDLFGKYGRLRNIDLKIPPRPPAFAFIEFDDARDAEDAVRGRDNYEFYGGRLRVEVAHGARGPGPAPTTFRRGAGQWRCIVKGLPPTASWQDLKDHFRKVVKPNYTNVFRDRGGVIGVVEFDSRDDLKRAIRKLDDTEFKNPFEKAYVRVIDDSEDRGRGRSVSRSPRRSRSRSRGRSYSRSRSRSRGRSASRSPSRSPSRSKSPTRSPSRSRSPAGDDKRSRSRSGSPRD